MKDKFKSFSGRFGDLSAAIYEDRFSIAQDDKVELIVKPPEGFEGIIPKKELILKPPPKPEEEEQEEKKPDPTLVSDFGEDNPYFTRRLRNILRDNAIQRHAGNKRDGDLDMKHLYKARTTGRCFTDKDIISNKMYSVALVVDCSGSMRGSNARLAGQCAVRFIRHFQKITQLSVVLFNAITEVVKYPHKQLNSMELQSIHSKIVSKPNYDGEAYGNHDAFAIMKATEILRPMRGKKIIVVINDGEPACDRGKCERQGRKHECYHTNPFLETKATVQQTIKNNHTVLGIGIGSEASSVKELYPDSEMVREVPQLYNSLIKLLQRTIKRGGI
jgi:hypothetical protein